MLTGRLVRHFGKTTQQVLVDVAHLHIAYLVRAEADRAELVDDLEQQVVRVQRIDAREEIELLEHVQGVRREAAHIVVQIRSDVVRVGPQLVHRVPARVVERESRYRLQLEIGYVIRHAVGHRIRRQDLLLRAGQHTIETTQNSERQDDVAILVLLVIATQQICHRPDKRDNRLMIHLASSFPVIDVIGTLTFSSTILTTVHVVCGTR